MSAVACAVWPLVLLSAVWMSEESGRFVDDLPAAEEGLNIHNRTKRYLCRYGEFQCMSGQCVDFTAMCDGVADCADMSDETAELCSYIVCPPHTFRCAYGACVDDFLRCDGKWDCVGGSDENYFLCDDKEKKPLTVKSKETTSSPVISSETTSSPVTSAETTSSPVTSGDTTSSPVTSAEMTSSPLISSETTSSPVTSAETTLSPLISSETTSSPVISSETTSSPGISAETTSSPVTSTETTTSPVISAETTSTPVTSAETTSSPVISSETTSSLGINAETTSSTATRIYQKCFTPKQPKYGRAVGSECSIEDTSPVCRGVEGTPVLPLTFLNYTCEPDFVMKGSPYVQCKEGSFTPKPPICYPVCGTKSTSDIHHFVTYGDVALLIYYPWMVAIYRNSSKTYNMTLICAGSLVTDRLVVSAAHCFWDNTRNAQQPKELYKFAFGKSIRDWNTAAYESPQIRDAKVIGVHERYKGRLLNHANDIAVIVLDEPVTFTTDVRPICLDWRRKYENIHLRPKFTGTVVGWGYTEKGEPSDTLRMASLPVIDFPQCWDTIGEKLRSYLTNDKFCAGYTNGTGARSGDSGGGFIFQQNGNWYLRGIVSVGEPDITNLNAYTAFTNVPDFHKFIAKFATQ